MNYTPLWMSTGSASRFRALGASSAAPVRLPSLKNKLLQLMRIISNF